LRCVGHQLQNKLKELMQKHDVITDVRGLGLMIGVEITGGSSLSPTECTDRILERMKDAGYLLGKTGPGRNVLTWMPPLISESEELLEAAAAFENVLQTL